MRASLTACAAISAFAFVDPAAAQSEASAEDIVLDGVEIAFYEIAPRRLAASMRRAVVAECARGVNGAALPSATKAREWLCDGAADALLRAVDGQGRGMVIGHVCKGDWRGKYYATSKVQQARKEAECVAISYGGVASAHILELNSERQLMAVFSMSPSKPLQPIAQNLKPGVGWRS